MRDKYFDRVFSDKETDEIRLFAMGDNDELHFRGNGSNSMLITVSGGSGNDVYTFEDLTKRQPKTSRFMIQKRKMSTIIFPQKHIVI